MRITLMACMARLRWVWSQTNQFTYPGGSRDSGLIQPQYAVTLGYSKQIVDLEGIHDLNLAANISYNFTNGDSGTRVDTTANYWTTLNTTNILSFSVEPGYYLAERAIAYLKLGYAQGQTTNTNNNPAWGNASFGTQSGPLFGFGFKHALDDAHPNVFWGLETYQINFNSKTINVPGATLTSKPTLLFGKVHLGYIF